MLIPSFINAREDKGLQSYRNQQFDKAREYYESILSKGENPSAAYGLGTSSFQLGEIESAMKAFDQVLAGEDDRLKAKSYYNMGNVLHQQNKMEESLAFYKKSLELDPTDADAKANYELVKYLMQQQNQNQENQQNQEKQDQQKQESEEKEQKEDSQQSDQSQEKKDNEQQEEKEEQSNPKQDQSEQSGEKEESSQNSKKEQTNQDKEKEENKKNAEVVLNALKQDDKINQKRKISKAASKKMEKDW